MTRLTLHIDSFAHGGLGVARDAGRVVFVADAIPGETVIAEVIEEKNSFARAVAVDVCEASPDRVAHIWPEAGIERSPERRAGGADLGFVRLERQRALKAEVIRDALRRFAAHHDSDPVVVEAVEPSVQWRSRVSLHVNADGVPGPRAARSHEVVPVSSHPLAAAAIAASNPWDLRVPGAERIDLLATSAGDQRTLIRRPREQSDHRASVREFVHGREFRVAEEGFWQVHIAAAETLQSAVAQALRAELLHPDAEQMDLYGGVGLLSIPLLDAVGSKGKVVTVESAARATELARENLGEYAGARAVTARVEQFLRRTTIDAGASVVLDPPRAGAGREVVQRLASSAASQVVYVACDPVAFARDLGTFTAAGWELEHLRAFDLFPHTHHLELVARLVPSEQARD